MFSFLSAVAGKSVVPVLTGGALLIALALEAGPIPDRRMGDDAMQHRDFTNAVKFYRAALASESNEDAWAEILLRLGEAELLSGDLPSARARHEEFRKRFPARSAGILPGMIFAAEGKNEQARTFFETLWRNPGTVSKEEISEQLGLVDLELKDYQAAEAVFRELSTSRNADWRDRGVRGIILTSIRRGDLKLADQEIAKLDLSDPENQKLRLCRHLAAGELDRFLTDWKQLKDSGKQAVIPDPFLLTMLTHGATALEKTGRIADADQLLADASLYVRNDAERRDNLRRRINLQMENSPAEAQARIMEYIRAFPSAPDRGMLLLQCGRLLERSGRYTESIEAFDRVMADGELAQDERIAAAYDAAAYAERHGDRNTARRMYSYAIRTLARSDRHYGALDDFAAYCLRQKDYAAALKVLEEIPEGADDRAEQIRIQALMGAEKWPEARMAAEQLSHSSVREFAMFARFQQGEIEMRAGQPVKAMDYFQKFSADFTGTPMAAEADFAVALIRFRSGEPSVTLLLAFAEKHPDSSRAASALFLALQEKCRTQNSTSAAPIMRKLRERYAKDPILAAAEVEFGTKMLAEKKYAEVLALADRQGPAVADPRMQDEFLLLKAKTLSAMGRQPDALRELRKALEAEPAKPLAPEIAMLAGEYACDQGDFSEGREFYSRALQSRSAGAFADAAASGIADASFRLAGSRHNGPDLERAEKIYRNLTEKSAFPAIQIRSSFHLGRCLLLRGRRNEAVSEWERTLYLASELRRSGAKPEPVWCAQAVYEALRVIVQDRGPGWLQRANRVIDLYGSLGLSGEGEDLIRLRDEVRSHSRSGRQKK